MKVPKEVENLINHYFSLQIGGKSIKTPYYINKKHARGGELRSLVGKGSPEEIEEEVMIFAKLKGLNLKKASEEEIRKFMRQEGIGIDCSGLVSHILDTWSKSINKRKLQRSLSFKNTGIINKIKYSIRPIQNMSANLLTNIDNTMPVKLQYVQTGDLIRLKGLRHGHHVAIIIDIYKDGKDRKVLQYVHSTPHYGRENGVRKGDIVIKDEEKELDKQLWKEFDSKKTCWTLKQYLKEQPDNGLRRPKFFMKNI